MLIVTNFLNGHFHLDKTKLLINFKLIINDNFFWILSFHSSAGRGFFVQQQQQQCFIYSRHICKENYNNLGKRYVLKVEPGDKWTLRVPSYVEILNFMQYGLITWTNKEGLYCLLTGYLPE